MMDFVPSIFFLNLLFNSRFISFFYSQFQELTQLNFISFETLTQYYCQNYFFVFFPSIGQKISHVGTKEMGRHGCISFWDDLFCNIQKGDGIFCRMIVITIQLNDENHNNNNQNKRPAQIHSINSRNYPIFCIPCSICFYNWANQIWP